MKPPSIHKVVEINNLNLYQDKVQQTSFLGRFYGCFTEIWIVSVDCAFSADNVWKCKK